MVPAKKDGFCFFMALHQCLERDHDIKISVDCIKDLLDYEIYQNNGEYIKLYGKGDVKHMLRALDDYLWKGKWAQDIGDIVVFAAAKCLKVNICIFQNVENRAMLFFFLFLATIAYLLSLFFTLFVVRIFCTVHVFLFLFFTRLILFYFHSFPMCLLAEGFLFLPRNTGPIYLLFYFHLGKIAHCIYTFDKSFLYVRLRL